MSQRHLQAFSKVLFLLLAVSMLIKPAVAQKTEVQIMVNGPWAYVPAPTPTPSTPPTTIVIATPVSTGHGPVKIFSGEDADEFPSHNSSNGIEITQVGKYVLTIDSLADCDPPPTPTPTPLAHAYPLRGVNVDSVIQGTLNGYAITLPKPCYYTSYMESRSKIDPVDPTAVQEKAYTTWMVLHYQVNAATFASVTGFAGSVPFQSNDSTDVPAISIAMGSMSSDDTSTRCDSLSVQSVLDEAALFNATLHVQFPRVKDKQQTPDYKPDCVDNTHILSKQSLTQVLKDITIVESFLGGHGKPADARTALKRVKATIGPRPPLVLPANVSNELKNVDNLLETQGKNGAGSSIKVNSGSTQDKLTQTRKYGIRTAAGAGDCRGAQFNVNDTIP